MCIQQFFALFSLYIMAVGATERAASIERDVSYSKQLLTATGGEGGGGSGLGSLYRPVQLNCTNKLKLYCIVFCLFVDDLLDEVISKTEYKES